MQIPFSLKSGNIFRNFDLFPFILRLTYVFSSFLLFSSFFKFHGAKAQAGML